MELERAHEILGLAPGASAEEIESAYGGLRDDLDARVTRVRSSALRDHYTRLRRLLEPAREAARAGIGEREAGLAEPLDAAFAALGLAPGASAVDVASAYVTLCDELDRELAATPIAAVRGACLAARAEIDAAYQRCAAQPLRGRDGPGEAAGPGYETQLADEPFLVAREHSASAGPSASLPRAPAKPRRRRMRYGVALALCAALAGAAVARLDGRLPADLPALLARFAPGGPPAELLEAHNTAEYLRRRMGDERRELQTRVQENRARVTRLEEEWTAARDPADYDRMAVEIGRARQRAEITEEIAALSETHVFESAEVAEAYGKIELGNELRAAGEIEEATQAFEAAWLGLEQALGRLDLAEEAVGARSEAQGALEAWESLARGAGLEDTESVRAGREVLAKGRALLEQGAFAQAVPELRGAARHFAVAVGDGRKRLPERETAGMPSLAPVPAPVGAPQAESSRALPGSASGAPAPGASTAPQASRVAGLERP